MGGLEVKRYIGSCLISAPADAGGGGGAGLVPLCGLPLVAVAPALSRLALHTHGAPLILAGRGRRHGPRNNNSSHQQQPQQQQHHKQQQPQARPQPQAAAAPAATSDSPNTASDESSGPSENSHSLPRIIKPRKRRKKDRKPAAAAPAQGSSIVTLRPYVPPCLEGGRLQPQTQPPQQHSKKPPQQQKQVEAAAASACQCRYCDPRGHIWDVRRHCYSPVLTAPASHESAFASIPLFLGAPPAAAAAAADSEDGFFSEDLPAAALRRSWSASSASSSFSSSSSSAGDACSPAPSAASQGLQVSTEIVTSPNGHRDLEIRFYSCSPPGADTAIADVAAAEAEEAAWTAEDADGGGCAEKLLGESLWANIVHADADADQ